ncbi:hypothetical protein [Collimonas sp. OK242]|uniref:hypothetical protein n=1 Tax=Collimonas sp. OK242 TaxID=1798195 RepID=UPI000B8940CC|nr:hypothetical protein [Collimonas sp. OK242]
MLAKALSLKACILFASALVVAYIVVIQRADNSHEAAYPAVGASYSEAQASSSASASPECAADTLANPFGRTLAHCNNGSDTSTRSASQGANTSAAAAIGKTLHEQEQCNTLHSKGSAAPADCNNSAPAEASMVSQLEELTRRGNSQAQFELSKQLQRQEQRSGRQMLNEADVAQDPQLQRAVALLAEAVAGGNVEAQSVRDAMGDHAKLLHTGR